MHGITLRRLLAFVKTETKMYSLTIIIALALIVLVLVGFIRILVAFHKAEIKDKNKNFVPDKVEDVVKEAQERVDNAVDALKGKR